MALFSINNVRIKGIAGAVPKEELSNWDYTHITEQERKLLIKTTGVEKRRMVGKSGITTTDLCKAAAERLLEATNTSKEDIQIVIFVSQTPDYFLPASSITLQNRLGLPKTCMAFDINLGCSGYVYGLSAISSLISVGKFKKALLLCGDISSAGPPEEDKSVFPLFGDGGTATLLEYDETATPMHFSNQSDGSGYEAIIVREGGMRKPFTVDSFTMVEKEKGISRASRNLELNGMAVFNFSVTEVPKNIAEFFSTTNTGPESYDFFVMHQANLLMNETIRKKMKFPPEKVPYTLPKFGNTSSASIPLTIVSELKDKVAGEVSWLLSGFGVGLSWATVSLKTTGLICPEIVEL
ncbi:MAG TPA: ketoacyl-ACP synthase III [Bacteroidia bacterium]|jgi:3-oxoacyl-[acyl-carrier-protein] synthase-3|nr:ketoacyl-ACP synthase III [Bacteroidia bacterium]